MSEFVVVGPKNGHFGVYSERHHAEGVAVWQSAKLDEKFTVREVVDHD